jgi:peptidoglycan/xylan/chitin deacetylase (PgdA/CDA1 family)
MKKTIIALTKTPVASGAVRLLEMLDREAPNLLRILTYHRIDDPNTASTLSPSTLSTTPAMFEQQMAFLRAHYHPISIEQVLECVQTQKPLPKRAVLVTFDDAYRDFEANAMPVLRQYDIPVVLFVPTDFPDHPERTFWWDYLYYALSTSSHQSVNSPVGLLDLTSPTQRYQAYKVLRDYVKGQPHEEAMAWVQSFGQELEVKAKPNPILSWDALRKLADDGVTMGAHTRSHPMLDQISLEQAQIEAIESRLDLERELGSSVPPIFAYPSGRFSHDVVNALETAGFELAFTTHRGINRLASANPLLLKRINVGTRTSLPILRAQLLPSTAYLT